MGESLSTDTLSEHEEGRLDQFKLEWMSGCAPDIKSHIVAVDSESHYLSSLIELDLNCRWKRYDRENQPLHDALDEHGFALFPKL
ncbi:MAG: hypothetical protein HON53_21100, partial [Planctomycetaceae bacterium]|nr:hypothetical protein [Planctomycetaceae bacterium]